ncbi:MAG: LytTR family DNA-binding domain-containing protein [Imperialibacter sp.]|uniref:LytR/AlgR family response regulator transcription factor n=1 Tax=Imperialibacter sp. TaxID=2038411 RepID=UPI0032EAB56C
MFTSVVVDDEESVINDLKGLLEMTCPHVKVVGTAKRSQEAIELIRAIRPQILFLDIQIDERTGLELLKSLEPMQMQVIFVTAHNDYAVEAFKLSAVDYLLKPVDPDELSEAVNRATTNIGKDLVHKQLTTLVHNLMPGANTRKIVLSDMDGLHILDIPDILWCHANGSYTEFKMKDGTELVVSKHLKTYERLLVDQGFERVHRSYLINIYNIKRIDRSRGEILMKNDETLPISIAADVLKEILSKLRQ